MFNRKAIKAEAKQSIKGNILSCFGATLIVGVILIVLGGIAGVFAYFSEVICALVGICTAILGVVFTYGIQFMHLRIWDAKKTEVGDVFAGFRNILKIVGISFMSGLLVSLWSLLLFIPGIIAAYRYSFALLILMDHPEMGVMDCIRESKRLTNGYKGDLFVTSLSFIGWQLLSSITWGLAGIYVTPYMGTTMAGAYRTVLALQNGDTVTTAEEPKSVWEA
jgi:uncharacterized membrane protein